MRATIVPIYRAAGGGGPDEGPEEPWGPTAGRLAMAILLYCHPKDSCSSSTIGSPIAHLGK